MKSQQKKGRRCFKRRPVQYLAIFLLLIFFRGALFRLTVSYEVINSRRHSVSSELKKSFLSLLDEEKALPDISELSVTALRITADSLRFSTKVSGARIVSREGRRYANCIGYARLYDEELGDLLDKHGLGGRYQLHRVVGKLRVLGLDIHRLIDDPFFRDHDFNLIEDRLTGELIAVDPGLYDYLGIRRVRLPWGG